MGFWDWFWTIAIAATVIGIFSVMMDSQKAQEQGTALTALPNLKPAVVFKGLFGGAVLRSTLREIGSRFQTGLVIPRCFTSAILLLLRFCEMDHLSTKRTGEVN
jgi:hypothetical protein